MTTENTFENDPPERIWLDLELLYSQSKPFRRSCSNVFTKVFFNKSNAPLLTGNVWQHRFGLSSRKKSSYCIWFLFAFAFFFAVYNSFLGRMRFPWRKKILSIPSQSSGCCVLSLCFLFFFKTVVLLKMLFFWRRRSLAQSHRVFPCPLTRQFCVLVPVCFEYSGDFWDQWIIGIWITQ